MRLMYSGRDFVRLYDRCDQLSFLDAHVRAFAYLGGVPERIVYDNLSAAVKKIVGSESGVNPIFRTVSIVNFRPSGHVAPRILPAVGTRGWNAIASGCRPPL